MEIAVQVDGLDHNSLADVIGELSALEATFPKRTNIAISIFEVKHTPPMQLSVKDVEIGHHATRK